MQVFYIDLVGIQIFKILYFILREYTSLIKPRTLVATQVSTNKSFKKAKINVILLFFLFLKSFYALASIEYRIY